MTYPEGECFFYRSSLSNGYYDTADPNRFYKNFLLEYVWNVPGHGPDGKLFSPSTRTHPRSGWQRFTGIGNGLVGTWDYLSVSYGTELSNIERRHIHNLCVNKSRFNDFFRGGSSEVGCTNFGILLYKSLQNLSP